MFNIIMYVKYWELKICREYQFGLLKITKSGCPSPIRHGLCHSAASSRTAFHTVDSTILLS